MLTTGVLSVHAQTEDMEILKEKEIALKDAPKEVQKAVNSDFPDAKIKEVDELTTKGGNIYYEIELVYEGEKLEVLYDAEGGMMSSEPDDEEEIMEEDDSEQDDD
ncbi:MAG: hypothetical protein H6606_06180 [Flavobacteriales bacterium]|nr:hypothetical protein [Flavobacteriales bacterium]